MNFVRRKGKTTVEAMLDITRIREAKQAAANGGLQTGQTKDVENSEPNRVLPEPIASVKEVVREDSEQKVPRVIVPNQITTPPPIKSAGIAKEEVVSIQPVRSIERNPNPVPAKPFITVNVPEMNTENKLPIDSDNIRDSKPDTEVAASDFNPDTEVEPADVNPVLETKPVEPIVPVVTSSNTTPIVETITDGIVDTNSNGPVLNNTSESNQNTLGPGTIIAIGVPIIAVLLLLLFVIRKRLSGKSRKSKIEPIIPMAYSPRNDLEVTKPAHSLSKNPAKPVYSWFQTHSAPPVQETPSIPVPNSTMFYSLIDYLKSKKLNFPETPVAITPTTAAISPLFPSPTSASTRMFSPCISNNPISPKSPRTPKSAKFK